MKYTRKEGLPQAEEATQVATTTKKGMSHTVVLEATVEEIIVGTKEEVVEEGEDNIEEAEENIEEEEDMIEEGMREAMGEDTEGEEHTKADRRESTIIMKASSSMKTTTSTTTKEGMAVQE